MAINKYLGPTGLTELINLIQNRLGKKQDWMQFPEMPSAAEYVGKVIQYTGTTDNDFTKGYFYYSNGVSWAQVNVMSAVVICKTSLPDWGLADPGLIYFVTSENKAYVRNNESEGEWYDLTNGEGAGPFIIVTTLPLWSDADPNKIYLLVESDGTSVTGYVKSSTLGKYYQLGGGATAQIVTTLPAWAAAKSNVVYYVINGNKLEGHVKNDTTANTWYDLAGGASFEIVNTLPTWLSADPDIIYFMPTEHGTLTGYIKNTSEINKFYEIGAVSTAVIKRYAESAHYDPAAAYDSVGEEFGFDGLEIESFTDDEIKDLYEEV